MNLYIQRYVEFKDPSGESRNIYRDFHLVFWPGHLISALAAAGQ
jgi:hypothetical protein